MSSNNPKLDSAAEESCGLSNLIGVPLPTTTPGAEKMPFSLTPTTFFLPLCSLNNSKLIYSGYVRAIKLNRDCCCAVTLTPKFHNVPLLYRIGCKEGISAIVFSSNSSKNVPSGFVKFIFLDTNSLLLSISFITLIAASSGYSWKLSRI